MRELLGTTAGGWAPPSLPTYGSGPFRLSDAAIAGINSWPGPLRYDPGQQQPPLPGYGWPRPEPSAPVNPTPINIMRPQPGIQNPTPIGPVYSSGTMSGGGYQLPGPIAYDGNPWSWQGGLPPSNQTGENMPGGYRSSRFDPQAGQSPMAQILLRLLMQGGLGSLGGGGYQSFMGPRMFQMQ